MSAKKYLIGEVAEKMGVKDYQVRDLRLRLIADNIGTFGTLQKRPGKVPGGRLLYFSEEDITELERYRWRLQTPTAIPNPTITVIVISSLAELPEKIKQQLAELAV